MSPFRALWIYAGNDAPYAKFKAAGVTDVYFDIREPRLSRNYFDAVATHGLGVGVYAAWNWWPNLTGEQFATKVSQRLEDIAPTTPPVYPKVCLDIETHSVPWIIAALTQWRKHRPGRVTDWTLESFQGGLFRPADVLSIEGRVRYTVPQFYVGDMAPVAGLESARNLADAGFDWGHIVGFYDATALPEWWQGYALGTLPDA